MLWSTGGADRTARQWRVQHPPAPEPVAEGAAPAAAAEPASLLEVAHLEARLAQAQHGLADQRASAKMKEKVRRAPAASC